MIFLSGQVARDSDGNRVGAGSMLKQTRQCLRNIKKSLTAARASLSDVVWTTVYMTDIREFKQIVAAREEFFKDNLQFPIRYSLQARIFSLACVKSSNQCTFSHSSRSDPLKDSIKALSVVYLKEQIPIESPEDCED